MCREERGGRETGGDTVTTTRGFFSSYHLSTVADTVGLPSTFTLNREMQYARTRGQNTIHLGRSCTNFYRNLLEFQAALSWNQLPSKLTQLLLKGSTCIHGVVTFYSATVYCIVQSSCFLFCIVSLFFCTLLCVFVVCSFLYLFEDLLEDQPLKAFLHRKKRKESGGRVQRLASS